MYLYIQSIYLDILCVFMKKKVCVHTHSGGERESEPLCKMLATSSRWSIAGCLLSNSCKFPIGLKAFKFKSWGEITLKVSTFHSSKVVGFPLELKMFLGDFYLCAHLRRYKSIANTKEQTSPSHQSTVVPSTHSGRKEGGQDDNSAGPQGDSYPAWIPCLALPLMHVCVLSCIRLFATPWTVSPQAPPSMGFSRQEYRLLMRLLENSLSQLSALVFLFQMRKLWQLLNCWKQQLFLSTSQVPDSARAGTRWRGPRCHRLQPTGQQPYQRAGQRGKCSERGSAGCRAACSSRAHPEWEEGAFFFSRKWRLSWNLKLFRG